MPHSAMRPLLMALAISGPVVAFVIIGRLTQSDLLAHSSAFVAVVLGLPWLIPAFVAIAVLSAPLYVALHIAGHPQPLMPWLSAVILVAGIVACHVNATMLFRWFLRRRAHTRDAGLADFLFRPATRTT
jgi:hypothetical protein